MSRFEEWLAKVEEELSRMEWPGFPANLYEPMGYILGLGGKRVRPVAVLMANACFKGSVERALPAAMAVEVFHNFTLMHDDIMDEAPVRRGKTTVHKKWNTTVAILSGDAMMVKAYQQLEKLSPEHLIPVLTLFNKTAIEVCEGQQLDMDFESLHKVSLVDYLEMIRLKTAVLLAASLQMGAITSNASAEDQQFIYDFGINLGLAFQLQDDLLDCFADSAKFGKQPGGDILENKKTFLLLKAMEKADNRHMEEIVAILELESTNDKKVDRMLTIYRELGIDRIAADQVLFYTEKAMESLQKVSLPDYEKKPLFDMASMLMGRES